MKTGRHDMKRTLTGVTIALVLTTVVHGQASLTGRWQGETRSGTQIVLELKATEKALTGTITMDGQPAAIADARVSKGTFTFNAPVRETNRTEGFTGELAGDQITFWPDSLGRDRAVALKRVKPASLTGQWQGETKNGMQVVLDLTATGTTVTGTITRDGTPNTIRDGKVSNGAFTFKAVLGDQDEAFTGELTGDQITVMLDRQGPSRAVILKRMKK
jgi:hypothetical protein